MEPIEIARFCKVKDQSAKQNTAIQINEIFSYLQKHMEKVAIDMAATGRADIPTSFGPYTLVYQDLLDSMTPVPPKSSFWKRALSIFKGEA